MIWSELIQRVIFLSLIGLGILGNILIFVRHVLTFTMGSEKKPIDLIIFTHLAFSNVIIIGTSGIRYVATKLHFKNGLGIAGCKTLVYLGRVARRLSICTTCLLSMVQVVTISPRTSFLRKFRPQTIWQVLPSLLLLCIFNVLISSNLLHHITVGSSLNRSRAGVYYGYCYMLPSRYTVKWLFLRLMTLRDVIFQCLMGWSSGYMALRLYKHHKCVLYLHTSRLANNASPEIRATWSVLILMTCFLLYYFGDYILSFYIGSVLTLDSIILNIRIFLVIGYAALSPFVLLIKDFHLISCWHTHWQVEETTFYNNPSSN
uniref:Vomeronasal type-1 receptor n=1 Tax=Mus musculus domesticus TaxID=10092 RepID=F6MCX6_MOUSE|nr:vomeronasal type 1 receptor I6 [Mus musculus domesticus]AEF00787.1 vomeronasal type 1 receptor I6 [Mus musculus domesticus]AEF00790.1 vomeronasal type 1 receptor I6 [Mus musculus domesticus]